MRFLPSLGQKALCALLTCAALLIGMSASAQSITKGKVVDESGEPVIGASVIIPGTTVGVITEADGTFSINAAKGTTLEVSCIGYVTKNVTAADNLNIVLEEDRQMLAETVVVGYGTMKKSDVTGSMVSVSSEELTQRPTNNVLEALQGKAAGVDIRTNERPGEMGSVYIRGQRSLNASSDPLYVVDGIPLINGALESLNPNDIASVEILKDASATAIYGSRGANGVVLVTTKKGSKDKMTISYDGSFTVEKLHSVTDMMNSADYIEWRRWAYHNAGSTALTPDQFTQDLDYVLFRGGSDPYAWANIQKGWASGTWDGSKVDTTDWIDLIMKTSFTHEHTLSVSGGNDKVQSYISFGYLSNEGTSKGQDYQRYTLKSNNDFQPYKWLGLGLNVNASYQRQDYGLSGAGNFQGGSSSSIYAAATNQLPYAVPFDDEGNRIDYPGGDDRIKNPYGEWDYVTDLRKTYRLMGSTYLTLDFGEMWEPLKGLSYRINFGPDFRLVDRGLYVGAESINRAGTDYALNSKTNSLSWTLDNLLYYNRDFGKHTVGVTLLHSADKSDVRAQSMDAEGTPLPSAKWNNMGLNGSLRSWSTSLTQRQMESYMARVNYSYDSRYMLTASIRRDGASVLASGHKWANFPSVALGWSIHNEEFMKNVSWVEQLKLRAGWGVTGNSAIDPYTTKGAIAALYYPSASSSTLGYTLYDSMLSSSSDRNITMANQELTWEKTTQYNVGLDFSILKGRISGVFDIYKSYTKDLLMAQSIPSLLGYASTYNNIGKTENFGYDITLNLVPLRLNDWEWTVDINAAYTKSKITELTTGDDDLVNNWFIGEPIGVIYSYESAGLWQESDAAAMADFNANGNHFEAGMARPVDQNNDNKIDASDRVILGNTTPKWTLGLNTAVSYKNWTLSAQLYGRFKFVDYGDAPWVGGRYPVREYDYWTPSNTGAKYTKPIYSEAGEDIYYQIVDIADRSYLKLRNVSLSYTFPEKLLRSTPISALKVYGQAKNLGSLFNKSEARDMDTGLAYYNRGFTFGVNVSF